MNSNSKKMVQNKSKGRVLRDSCLIVFFLLLSILLFFIIQGRTEPGSSVVVAVDGVQIGEYSLFLDGEYPLNNGSNILRIENKTACMIEANCPDQLCMRQGKIQYTGQCITCLPNKLTVTVIGGDDSVDIVL